MYPLWAPVRANRDLEWSLALTTLFLGLWLMCPELTFSPLFARVAGWMSEDWWARALFVSGVGQFAALIINGAKHWTPMVRVVSLIPGALAYATLAYGLWLVNSMAFGVAMCLVLLAWTLTCIHRATADACHVRARRDVGIHH